MIKSDGNGGIDINGNIQKTILKKYGLLGIVFLIFLGGLASSIGEEAWAVLLDRNVIKSDVQANKEAFDAHTEEQTVFRKTLEERLDTIQHGQTEMRTMLRGFIERANGPEGR